MTKTLTAAVFAVLLLLLTACGGSGSDSEGSKGSSSSASPSVTASASDDEATAATSISDSLVQATASGSSASQMLTLNRKDADCIGKDMVDELGTDKLQKYGMLTEDMKVGTGLSSLKMSKPDAEATTDVVFSCTDVAAMMRTAIGKSGSIPKQLRGCVNNVLTEDNLRPMFGKVFQGKQAAAQKELTAPLLACAKKVQRPQP
jgi:hypothetical protein